MLKLVLEGFLVFEEGVGSNPTLDKDLFTLCLIFFTSFVIAQNLLRPTVVRGHQRSDQ
jgi:hypothetical protein